MREFYVLSSQRQRHFWPKLIRRCLTAFWILVCAAIGILTGALLAQELH